MTVGLPSLTFVIPVRDDAQQLARCLASIRRNATGCTPDIIVADNGSTDGSPDVARAAGALVVPLPARPVSEVRNIAAAGVTTDLIAFVDADHELAEGWIAAATAAFSDPKVWAVGASYHTPSDGTWVQKTYDLLRPRAQAVGPVDWLASGNLVVRRTAFEHVGGFDTSLESCEDVDLCRRIRHAGGVLLENPALRSTHFGDPRTLKALFFSELWRGRDNLRVSLRERLTLRNAPSIVLPVLQLLALAAAAGGAVVWAMTGSPWITISGVFLSGMLIALRALRLWLKARPLGRPLLSAQRALAVGATYDVARALALVVRADHGVRRRT